jgi:diaminohydroxyphosphoribosylaminopyrimidine deaminase/5-amino-6-(5-phosphoribosylamino)uracil reductase
MAMALAVAKNPGLVEPNPQVGAVLVRKDKVIATGRHEHFGGPHAEVNALRKAGRKAEGATLYVNLEPCCTFGKTPPCTDALLAAQVAHVVIGAPDPTQGRSVQMLRRAGIRVTTGILKEEALRLNAPFYKLKLWRQPYVIAKWAMSLDGKIATRTGDSRWISCPESRHLVHRLRSVVDGVLVGVGTVLADDPTLTPRLEAFDERVTPRRRKLLNKALAAGKPPFHRIVLDSTARTPLASKLVKTAHKAKTLIAVSHAAPSRRCRLLEGQGCEVLHCKAKKGRVYIEDLLRQLAVRRLTNVLVEGGGAVLGSFFEADCVDQVMIFIAPKIIGGAGALGPLGGLGVNEMVNALELKGVRIERSGIDALIHGYTRNANDYLT